MLTDNAIQILEDRFLLRDTEGRIVEDPDQLFRRVAKSVANAEKIHKGNWESRFYDIMRSMQ
ncbi:MAG: hypothetical protein KJN85_16595, partial [Maribacter sp.]|nr:hypothetical protein [Maribacter sp.]